MYIHSIDSQFHLPGDTKSRMVSLALLEGAQVYWPAWFGLVAWMVSWDTVVLGEASHSWLLSGPIMEVDTFTPL